MPSLNKFLKLREVVLGARRGYLNRFGGLHVHETSSISLSARLCSARPNGITIGDHTLIAFKTLLLTETRTMAFAPIRIGRHCFIGGGSIIMPGVTIGDSALVGAGSVVFDDVPANSIVAGNPARIIREGVTLDKYGQLPVAAENRRKRREMQQALAAAQ